jgi:hypothetical protein
MKNVLFRWSLMILLVLSAGCATHSPEERAAVVLAGAIESVMVEADFAGKEVFTGVPCALIVQKGLLITKINGESGDSMKTYVLPDKNPRYFWSENKPIFFPPGKNTFTILVGERANDPEVTVPFTFEEGKHYSLDFIMHPGTVNFIIGEITDKAKLTELAEKVAEKQEQSKVKAGALADNKVFSTENPAWLEGKWSAGKGKDELAFSGNTVKYVAAESLFFDTRTTLEGVFVFNKNSLVIRWNSFLTSANSLTRKDTPNFFENLPVYYLLQGDTLEVRHGGILPVNISGTYQRIR